MQAHHRTGSTLGDPESLTQRRHGAALVGLHAAVLATQRDEGLWEKLHTTLSETSSVEIQIVKSWRRIDESASRGIWV